MKGNEKRKIEIVPKIQVKGIPMPQETARETINTLQR